MGYDVHITRREEWFDEEGDEISLEEWKRYVASDEEMRLDGFAEVETPDGMLRVESEGLSVWLRYSGHGKDGNMAWFDHSEGNVTVKNPDDEILRKMFSIAQSLNAKVQGDEGEVYAANGQSNWQELKQQTNPPAAGRKWWQFWR